MFTYRSLLLMLAASGLCGCTPDVRVTLDDATVDQVRQIVATQMDVDLSKVTARTSLKDLGADELDFVEIVMEVEERFQVTIPDSFGGSIQQSLKVTIADFVTEIERLKAAK